ncbi:hypothetical protein [Sediminibacterium sp.]|jgi:hypothetical protein|uniref:hypothetical protein n=1 Tax=Sediminibacterium sp. TaxID=1917865 RepID=UPI0025DCE5C1|nr:hypothetical protein [Sediminibacterium sp.]MBW0178152.1 hypothetical protein [Sediminibacterium sp.]
MKPRIETSVTISVQAVEKLASLLSSYLTPEYNALFAGWKKLAEKAYSQSDSSIPLVAFDTSAS